MNYRGRIAPTPTGFLHVGHAYTFGIAAKRAAGELVFRVDDLDSTRCTDEYTEAAIEDLRWLGFLGEGLTAVVEPARTFRAKEQACINRPGSNWPQEE